MRTFLRSFTVILLISGASASGQDQSAEEIEVDSSVDSETDSELIFDEDSENGEGFEGEVTESDQQDTPDRFIPSEQISQDLGVSFPADI